MVPKVPELSAVARVRDASAGAVDGAARVGVIGVVEAVETLSAGFEL